MGPLRSPSGRGGGVPTIATLRHSENSTELGIEMLRCVQHDNIPVSPRAAAKVCRAGTGHNVSTHIHLTPIISSNLVSMTPG